MMVPLKAETRGSEKKGKSLLKKKTKKNKTTKRGRERQAETDRERERESCVGGEYRHRWCSPPLLWEQLRDCRYHGRNSRRGE